MLTLLRVFVDSSIDTAQGLRLFLRGSGGWWAAAMILAAAVFCMWSYRHIRTPIRPAYRRQMILLRMAMLLVLFFLLLRPTLQFSALRKPAVAVMLDTSTSMGTEDAYDDQSYQAAEALLQGHEPGTSAAPPVAKSPNKVARITFASLAAQFLQKGIEGNGNQGFAVRGFAFDDGLREAALTTATARGTRTDLAGSLRELSRTMRGEPLIAVVVISDGVDNVGGNLQDTLRSLGQAETPVYSVAVGGTTERPDIRLTDVQSPAFAFLGSRFAVETTLSWQEIEGAGEIQLYVGDEQIEVRPLEFASPQGATRVRFNFTADTSGKQFCRLEVPAKDGEVSAENNVRHFTIDVLDDFRVLLVTATPRAEFRFLRQFLERDSRIRVTSLLATPSGRPGRFYNVSQRASDRELVFPLTKQDIQIYQAVIFGDIEARHLSREQQNLLSQYVDNGSGFLMLGGMHTFVSGAYAGTPVADLLPVELTTRGEPPHKNDNFLPVITAAGQRMPFFQSSAFASGEFEFADLPPVGGLNIVGDVKPSATALAVHPGTRTVVMATAPFGRGRTMALTIDETWRWRFEDAWKETNPAAQFYRDFWGQIVRWLGIPQERPGVRVILPAKEIVAGSTAIVDVQLLDDELSPVGGVTPRLSLRRGAADAPEEPVTLALFDERRGEFTATLDGLHAGTYWLRASAEGPQGQSWNDEDMVVVRPPTIEIERTSRNDSLLRSLSRATGGEFLEIDMLDTVPGTIRDLPFRERRRFRRVGESELWDAWSMLVLLIGLYTLELRTRRKAGIL